MKFITDIIAGTPKRYDFMLLAPTLFLVGLGVVMVYSASGVPAGDRLGDSAYYLQRQAIWAALGFGFLIVSAHIPYPRVTRLAPILLLFAVVLLVAVHLPGIGLTRGGATRWLAVGPFTFQPSEAAKLAMIVYLARYYATRGDISQFKDAVVKPGFVCAPLIVLVLLQPDYGTAVAMTTLFCLMAFIAGTRIKHMAAVTTAAIPVGIALIYFAQYRMRRLIAFIDPWEDMSDGGFQIIQSFLAFAGGGLFGRGLGDGLQKLYFLPEAHSDFVLSLVGEELGFIGLMLVVVAYAAIVMRGIQVAASHGDSLGRMLAAGLTATIGLQALINGAVVTGMLPTKGITLPFVSYGGSSLLMMMIAMGLLLNVSAHAGGVWGEDAGGVWGEDAGGVWGEDTPHKKARGKQA